MRPSTQCAPYPNYSGALGPANPKSPFPQGDARSASDFLLKSIYAKAHAADPVYSLRRNPLRHLTFETSFSRFYKVPIPWTQRHPRDPTPTPTPQGTQGDPRAQGGGGQGGPKGAFGALGGDGPMGPFGVIPKPFRMECHFEWKVITKGNPLRNESRS